MRRVLARMLRWLLNRVEVDAAPPPPTRSQLSENVQHVCYEMAAMERAADLVTRGGRFRFEAFHLHARLLREFFWRRADWTGPGAENSLIAEHYFEDYSDWRGIRGGLPPTLRATKERVDRQVAHLARDRDGDFMDLEEKVPDMKSELAGPWKRFLGAVPTTWAAEFRSKIKSKRELLAKNDC